MFVPWDDKELKVAFATFRDRLRPGQKETWRVTVKGPRTPSTPLREAAELLAYMYDQEPRRVRRRTRRRARSRSCRTARRRLARATLGAAPQLWLTSSGFPPPPTAPVLLGDRLKFESGYGIGGPGGGGAMGGAYNRRTPPRRRR